MVISTAMLKCRVWRETTPNKAGGMVSANLQGKEGNKKLEKAWCLHIVCSTSNSPRNSTTANNSTSAKTSIGGMQEEHHTLLYAAPASVHTQ